MSGCCCCGGGGERRDVGADAGVGGNNGSLVRRVSSFGGDAGWAALGAASLGMGDKTGLLLTLLLLSGGNIPASSGDGGGSGAGAGAGTGVTGASLLLPLPLLSLLLLLG